MRFAQGFLLSPLPGEHIKEERPLGAGSQLPEGPQLLPVRGELPPQILKRIKPIPGTPVIDGPVLTPDRPVATREPQLVGDEPAQMSCR